MALASAKLAIAAGHDSPAGLDVGLDFHKKTPFVSLVLAVHRRRKATLVAGRPTHNCFTLIGTGTVARMDHQARRFFSESIGAPDMRRRPTREGDAPTAREFITPQPEMSKSSKRLLAV
jgi:hypothetical protein